jgi:hypothetical protein
MIPADPTPKRLWSRGSAACPLRAGHSPGLDGDFSQEARHRVGEPDEVQTGVGCVDTSEMPGIAIGVQHTEVAHQRLQAWAVARGHDDRVDRAFVAVAEVHRRALEAGNVAHDFDVATSHCGNRPHVDEWCGVRSVELRGSPERRRGDAGSVADREPGEQSKRPVPGRGRKAAANEGEVLNRDSADRPTDDVLARPDRPQDLGRPVIDQVKGNLGTRVTRADDQNALPGVCGTVAVVTRVNDRPVGQCAAGP